MLSTTKIGPSYTVMKLIIYSLGIIVLASSVVGCANKTVGNHQGENTMPPKPIEEVLKEHTDELMAIPGVVGTAQGLCDGNPCIKVYVVKKTRELQETIPTTLEGYPVSIQETGEIKALDDGG